MKDFPLKICDLSFSYVEDEPLFENFDFEFEKGKIYSVLGKSGVGKTTLINIIAGVEQSFRGSIRFGDHHRLAEENIAYHTQNYRIFGHIRLIRQMRLSMGKSDDEALIEKILAALELDSLKNAFPANFSGGQLQRASLAISLITRRSVLLLDEPLSAVHDDLREKIQEFLVAWVAERDLICLWVAHQMEEALFVGSQILMLKKNHPSEALRCESVISTLAPKVKRQRNSYYFRDELMFISNKFNQLIPDEKLGEKNLETYGLVDEYSLGLLESRADVVWIIDANINTERKNQFVRNTVRQNLKMGKKYHYFIPSRYKETLLKTLSGSFEDIEERNSNRSEEENHSSESILKNLIIRDFSEDHWLFGFEGIAIYDPGKKRELGFSYLGSRTRNNLWQLPRRMVQNICAEINKQTKDEN